MLFSHSYRTEVPLVIDIVSDIRRLNDMTTFAPKAGMIILGGGVCKHQVSDRQARALPQVYSCSAHFSDCECYAVSQTVPITQSLSTRVRSLMASDSGARPDEAVSWGKIQIGAEAVKVRHSSSTVCSMASHISFLCRSLPMHPRIPTTGGGHMGRAHWEASKHSSKGR